MSQNQNRKKRKEKKNAVVNLCAIEMTAIKSVCIARTQHKFFSISLDIQFNCHIIHQFRSSLYLAPVGNADALETC